MGFLILPFVFVGGVLLAGCSGGGSSDRPTGGDAGPNPSGSAVVPNPSATAVVPSPPLTGSSLVDRTLSTPRPAVEAGPAPGGDVLARYPGADDAARSRAWALNRSIESYFTIMRRDFPGASARGTLMSIIGDHGAIRTDAARGPLTVNYTVGGVAQPAVTVSNAESIFLSRLIAEDANTIRTLMHIDGQPDLTDPQVQELKTAANDLLREARAGAGGDAGAPVDTAPRPAGSVAPRPARTGGNPSRPPVRNPTGPDIFY